MNWHLLLNSLAVAGGTAFLAAVAGLCSALFAAGLGRGTQRTLVGIAVLGLALPPFVVVNCWLTVAGAAGTGQASSVLSLFSLPGVIWVLTLMLWPIAFLGCWSALCRIDPGVIACDPAIRGWRLILGVLLPILKPVLFMSCALVFVLAFNNFAVPAILQQKVLPAEIWVRFNTQLDAVGALGLSWPLVLVPVALFLCVARRDFPLPDRKRRLEPALYRRQLGAVSLAGCGAVTAFLCVATLVLPLSELAFARRTWTELPAAVSAGGRALWNSVSFSAAAALLVAVLGLVLAFSMGGHDRRGRLPIPLMLINALLWLPFLVPGVVLGVGLIEAFNRPLTRVFYSSVGIVLLALVIRYVVIGWQAAAFAARRIDRNLVDAARLDGASFWQMLRHVYWPQAAPQLVAGGYVVYLLCLWDVETILLVIPPGGETLGLRVFNMLHYGHNAQVNALCLVLLGLALAPLCLFGAGKLIRSRARSLSTTLAWVPVATMAMCTFGCAPEPNPREARLESALFSRAEVIGSRGVGAGQFNKPRSLALDLEQNLYVADMTGRVQKLTPEGQYLTSWQLPQTDLGKPKGMCRGRDGDILVIEPHYQRVNHFSPSGKLLRSWGRRGTGPGEFTLPRAVAVNSRGEIVVSEYTAAERVQVFSSNGSDLVRTFGQSGMGPGEFNRPEGLCVDSHDRVYVADSCNHRIQIFAADGTLIRAYGKPGSRKGELSYPYDICVDPVGRQYVCEFGNSRIQVFDANCEPLEIIGGPGAAPGRFNNPWGVALDSAGNLYVADALNHRVQKLIRRGNHNPVQGT